MALPWRGGWSKESRRRPARPAKNAMGARCKPTNRQTTASSAESRRPGSMKGLSDVMDASGSTNGLSGACQTEMEEYAQRVAVHQNRSWGALRQTVQGTVLRSGWSAVNFDERAKPALTLQIPTTQEARGINGHLILQCGCGTDGSTRTRGKAIEASCARLQFPSPIFSSSRKKPVCSLSRFVSRLLQPADSMPQRRRFRLRNRQPPHLGHRLFIGRIVEIGGQYRK